jgi:hypothetical protein
LLSHGRKICPVAFGVIKAALSEKHIETSAAPASCAAMLAQKIGVSDLPAVMAAGFAGGIGLSGGACGALGAAIWIIGMNCLKEGVGLPVFSGKHMGHHRLPCGRCLSKGEIKHDR